jgi:hypothetical protein
MGECRTGGHQTSGDAGGLPIADNEAAKADMETATLDHICKVEMTSEKLGTLNAGLGELFMLHHRVDTCQH